MGKFVKIALVFMGGMTAGGYCVVNAALKSKTFTEILKQTIKQKTVNFVDDIIDPSAASCPKYYKHRSPVSYKSYYSSNYTRVVESDDLIFSSKDDAERVLNLMKFVIDTCGIVTVADFYELSEKAQPDYAANKYGWRSVAGARVLRDRDGYYIKLPRAIELK